MKDKIYKVYELNKMVKEYLSDSTLFKDFFLVGEMSNVTYYKSGHLYFTLKDKKAAVKCVAFSYKFKKIPKNLKEGDKIKLFGDITLYEATGTYQVLVRHVELHKEQGDMFIELEKLKIKLKDLGYFDLENKKKLPILPFNIGIVTSETGAAIKDIIKTAKSRFTNINIYYYGVKVQGDGATKEIAKGIEVLDKLPEIDLIICGRGGGSIEDLWAFNEELTCEAFYNCKKPIVSAVGHEIDFLLTDLIADLRAGTPTRAAELVVPEKLILKSNLNDKKEYIDYLMKKLILDKKKILDNLKNRYIIKNFHVEFYKNYELIIEKHKNINQLFYQRLKGFKDEVRMKKNLLDSLNPIKVLKRGYSLSLKDGKIIKNIEEIKENDTINIIRFDGSILSEVKEINKK